MFRKHSRRVAALSIVTCLALAACGSSSGGTEPVSAPSTGPQTEWAAKVKQTYAGQTITVAAATHPGTAALQKLTNAFTEQTGIKVVWDVVDENSLKNKQELDYQSGAGRYDVLMTDGFWLSEYADKKIVAPVDSLLKDPAKTPAFYDYDDLAPAYRKGLTQLDGKTYGVPMAGETRFVAYRKDLFEKEGKQPPKTLDEMLELARYFKGKDGQYGISMRGQKGIQFTSGLMTVMYGFTKGFFDPKTGASMLTTPETTQAMNYYLDLLKNAPEDVGSYTHEEALSAFMSGNAAMWFDATSLAPEILDPDKSAVADKVGFVAPPAGPRGQYGALAGWSLGLAAKTKNTQAAWAFILWMTSKETARSYVDAGGTPTRLSVLDDPQTDAQRAYYPAMKEGLVAADNLVSEGISWIPRVPKSIEKLVTIGDYGSQALAGKTTGDQALASADKAISRG